MKKIENKYNFVMYENFIFQYIFSQLYIAGYYSRKVYVESILMNDILDVKGPIIMTRFLMQ